MYHVYIKRILFFIFRFSDNHGHKSLPTFQTIINTYTTQDNVPPLPPQSMLSHRPSITTQSKKLQALVQLHGILNEPYFEWSFWMILLIYQNNLDCGGRGIWEKTTAVLFFLCTIIQLSVKWFITNLDMNHVLAKIFWPWLSENCETKRPFTVIMLDRVKKRDRGNVENDERE